MNDRKPLRQKTLAEWKKEQKDLSIEFDWEWWLQVWCAVEGIKSLEDRNAKNNP